MKAKNASYIGMFVALLNAVQVNISFNTMRFIGLAAAIFFIIRGRKNIIAAWFLIPPFYALNGLHRERLPVFSGVALLLIAIAFTILFAGNVSFAFLELAQKYSVADEIHKASLIS